MPTEGSRVEYLPVGSQEATQTIIAKKNFKPWNPKSQSQPSVQRCLYHHHSAEQKGKKKSGGIGESFIVDKKIQPTLTVNLTAKLGPFASAIFH